MKIFVTVKPNSKVEKVEEVGENKFILRVKAPAKEGKANEAVIKLLSGYFAASKSSINILRGQSSKNKIVDIG